MTSSVASFSLFIILSLMIPTQIWANSLLKCLGAEEERYHKARVHHSRAKLNLEIISELAQYGDIRIKENYFQVICHPKEKYPAERLLEMQLKHGQELYDFYGNRANLEIIKGMLAEYHKQLPQMFLRYMGNLQAELKKANCLDQKIPELKKIKEKIKYTEEDLSTQSVIALRNEIGKVFNKLKNFARIKLECQAIKTKN